VYIRLILNIWTALVILISTVIPQNTTQKCISIVFCVSSIHHDSSLSKYRKQKQFPPGNTKNGACPWGWLLLFTVLAEWRIMMNRAYAKNNGVDFCVVFCGNTKFLKKDGVWFPPRKIVHIWSSRTAFLASKFANELHPNWLYFSQIVTTLHI
jgi:hypothetical protein